MIKVLLTWLFSLLALALSFAQTKEDLDQIKTLKVAYFTEHLSLTPEEATQFWPIYNLHEAVIYAQ